MNMLRFKAPALIELNMPSVGPATFTIPLTRDIKVVNGFGFASTAEAGEDSVSGFQIFTVCQSERKNITSIVPLGLNTTSYVTEVDPEWMTLRTGWVLGVEVFGRTQGSVYIWAIPLPQGGR